MKEAAATELTVIGKLTVAKITKNKAKDSVKKVPQYIL